MRLSTKIAIGALTISAVGGPLAVYVPQWAKDGAASAHDAAHDAARERAAEVCDRALRAAEQQARATGRTGPDTLERSLTKADPTYAAVWGAVVASLPAQKVSAGAHSALSAAASQAEKDQWHASAVGACSAQLASRIGL